MPHRKNILSQIMRDRFDLLRIKVIDPDIVRLAAAVPFPRSELTEDPVVGHLLAIR